MKKEAKRVESKMLHKISSYTNTLEINHHASRGYLCKLYQAKDQVRKHFINCLVQWPVLPRLGLVKQYFI